MRIRFRSALRALPRTVALAVAASSSLALATSAFAGVPVGWSVTQTIDGGTSSIGSSIAATDSVAVVGAPFAAATPGGTPTGAVLVYSSGGGGWTSQQVAAPSPIDGGNFGTSVAASGNLVAVGAAGTPPAAYVFAADGGAYQLLQMWADPASDTNGSFGGSVAVYAGAAGPSYVAVAAPPGSASAVGTVYVSRQVGGGAWSNPPAAITDPSAASFGIAIAFAGNGELLVGDPGTGAGQVKVYEPLPDGGWAPLAPLSFSLDGGSVQQFGSGIATWNDLAVVTAPGSADDAGTYQGVAFVFAADDAGVWAQQAALTGAPAESFGNFPPAVGGGFIAVGSAINTASSGTGQVDVWVQSGGSWVPVPSSALVGDAYYGQAVGVVGGTAFVGDTSALGAASIDEVTSSLILARAVYADAGVPGDGGVDAAPPSLDGGASGADGAAPPGSLDATLPGSPDAASPGDSGAGAGANDASSGGCSCASAGEAAGGGGGALLALSAFPWLAWGWRRRMRGFGRAKSPGVH